MSLRRFSLVALAACALALSACGIDAELNEFCRIRQTCECDGADCCIVEGSACYEGQCCPGLVCSGDGEGTCVPAQE